MSSVIATEFGFDLTKANNLSSVLNGAAYRINWASYSYEGYTSWSQVFNALYTTITPDYICKIYADAENKRKLLFFAT